MSLIKRWLIAVTKPLVWRLAAAYDLRVDGHCVASGPLPLIIEDNAEGRRHHIPKSVRFNTGSGTIRVGANTVFGEDVHIVTGKHLNIAESTALGVPLHTAPREGRDITIGRGCFIGTGAIIVGPVTIGDYAVISAGSVVMTDVPPRTVVAGVPARVLLVLQ